MKKIYILLSLGLFISCLTQAQPVIQASLGPGSTANSVKIYVKSATAQSPTVISTLQFNIGISASISPIPTVTVRSSNIAGVSWGTETAVLENGYNNFAIQTPASPLNFNLAANVDFEVAEIAFSGGPIALQNVSLVTLPDGGSNGKLLFLSTGSHASVGNNLYYTRTGITVNNQFSYDASGAASGTAVSTATVGNISLPTKFLSFFATKSNDVANLTWTVDNEENNAYFDVERSLDGRNFTKAYQVQALRNGRTSNSYTTPDANISRLGVKTIYYRIKQVEASGQIVYSDIRQVNLVDKNFSASLFPNPVKSSTKLVIDAPEAGKATVIIRDVAGKTIKSISLQLVKGINQQQLDASMFAAGDYNVTIVSEKMNQTIKMTKAN